MTLDPLTHPPLTRWSRLDRPIRFIYISIYIYIQETRRPSCRDWNNSVYIALSIYSTDLLLPSPTRCITSACQTDSDEGEAFGTLPEKKSEGNFPKNQIK